jgi:inward rectifier potassium channel
MDDRVRTEGLMTTRYDYDRDLGFGSVVSQESRRRLVNRDGSFNVRRDGLPFWASLSLYHVLLRTSWPRLLGFLGLAYLALNVLFAAGFLLAGPGALGGMAPVPGAGRFWQAFFFSVETFGTIGYGNIYPVGFAANLLMTVESFVGLTSLALATGVVFSRFARPAPKILFSRHAVIAPYRGITAFEFRVVNQLSSQLVELECTVIFSRIEPRDGKPFRNYYSLPLERSQVSLFPLSWTVVHPIDESSPLRGATRESLTREDAEFIVLLTGFEETLSQTVHTRSSYKPQEITWGARFADVFNHDDPRGLSIDVGRLHRIEPAALPDTHQHRESP